MSSGAKPEVVWWARPSRMLPIVATILVIVALLTPQQSAGRFGDSRLSSNLAGTMGGRVLADLAGRLGWRIERDSSETMTPRHGGAIHAVLAPPIPVSRAQAHAYLEAVRNGDALLLVLGERDPLADSLAVRRIPLGVILPENEAGAGGCTRDFDDAPSLWVDGRVHLFPVRWRRDQHPDTVNFGHLAFDSGSPFGTRSTREAGNAAVGFPLGRGRVVVVADPDLLRNDVLRHCRWGTDVIAVKILEWLRAGGDAPRTALVFDEFHQGFGKRGSTSAVVYQFLVDHPFGRFVLALAVAGIVLLISRAPRAIVPVDVERIERRDPLEQVDALSHAYEQVRATRTITARLVRGMRWRVQRAGAGVRSASDAEFLAAAAQRYPAVAADVDLVHHALDTQVDTRGLRNVGAAIHRIEDTLTKTTA
jgi:hypothetical protein